MKETDNLSIHDNVAIFLNIFAQNEIQRYVRKIFGHSHETISRQFHEMLSALEKWRCIFLYMIHTRSHKPHPRLQLKQTVGFILKDLLVQLMEHMLCHYCNIKLMEHEK